ncbi:hypothetical protein KM043_013539 [Ampulex compressa]|nr:hypothetical protein KM043_013539 [Ampulex compressa]
MRHCPSPDTDSHSVLFLSHTFYPSPSPPPSGSLFGRDPRAFLQSFSSTRKITTRLSVGLPEYGGARQWQGVMDVKRSSSRAPSLIILIRGEPSWLLGDPCPAVPGNADAWPMNRGVGLEKCRGGREERDSMINEATMDDVGE